MSITNIGVYHYLVLGIILFSLGLLGVIISRELIRILLSVEIMISAVCINFVSVGSLYDGIKLEGLAFSAFIIMITFIQTVIFVSIIINIYKHKKITTVDKLDELKG